MLVLGPGLPFWVGLGIFTSISLLAVKKERAKINKISQAPFSVESAVRINFSTGMETDYDFLRMSIACAIGCLRFAIRSSPYHYISKVTVASRKKHDNLPCTVTGACLR